VKSPTSQLPKRSKRNVGVQPAAPIMLRDGQVDRCMSFFQKTILVVDDEEPIRNVIAMALSRCGHRILVAGDYDMALSVYRELGSDLDVLITDVSLPGRTGCEVAADMLALQPNLKVLYISGYAGCEVFRLNEGPPASFLAKPFQPEQIRECVSRLLGEYAFSSESRATRR
jgi:DNA-binding NtrC family response regulator